MSWEDSLMATPSRISRRATTGTVVQDNSTYAIRTIEHGVERVRSIWYYRRHLNGGIVFTGRRRDGLALHLLNS